MFKRNKIKSKNQQKVKKILALSVGTLIVGTTIPVTIQIDSNLKAQKLLDNQQNFLNSLFEQFNQDQDLVPETQEPDTNLQEETPFDENKWWSKAPTSKDDNTYWNLEGINTPPKKIAFEEFYVSSKSGEVSAKHPYFNNEIALWIEDNIVNNTNEDDRIRIYYEGADVTSDGLSIGSGETKKVEFELSTKNRYKEGKEGSESVKLSITWSYSRNQFATESYWSRVTKALDSFEGYFPETAHEYITIADLLGWLGIESGPTFDDGSLPEKLELLNEDGNKSMITVEGKQVNGLKIPPNQKEIRLKLGINQHDSIDPTARYTSNLITITWKQTIDQETTHNFWTNDVLTSIDNASKIVYSDAPDPTYSIGKITNLMSLPNPKSKGLSGNYVLLPAWDDLTTHDKIKDRYQVLVEPNQKILSFRIAFPRNGQLEDSKELKDYFVSEIVNLEWEETRNEEQAAKEWKDVLEEIKKYIEAGKTIVGGAPLTLSLQDVFDEIGNIGQIISLPGKIQLLDSEGKPYKGDELTIDPNSYNVSFKLGFPINGVNNDDGLHTSPLITFKWAKTHNEIEANDWWEKYIKKIPGQLHLGDQRVPDKITINDFVKLDGILYDFFEEAITNRPVDSKGNHLAGFKLFFSNRKIDDEDALTHEGITLDNDTKEIILTLQYPETGSWDNTGDNVLSKSFTITWNQTRNEMTAADFWDAVMSEYRNGMIAEFKDFFEYPIKDKFTIADLRHYYSFPEAPNKMFPETGTLNDLEIWYQGKDDERPKKVDPSLGFTLMHDQDLITFTLAYPKDGLTSTNNYEDVLEVTKYYHEVITWNFKKTINEDKVAKWWDKRPSESGEIHVGEVAPKEELTIEDFYSEGGVFSNVKNGDDELTFKEWMAEKPTFATSYPELLDQLGKPQSTITIDQDQNKITIGLRFFENGLNAEEDYLSAQYSFAWDKSFNENAALKYWNKILAKLSQYAVTGQDYYQNNLTGHPDPLDLVYNIDDVKSDFALPNPDPTISVLQGKLNIDPKSITIHENQKEIAFTLKFPKMKADGSNEYFTAKLKVTWEQSIYEFDIQEWFNELPTQYSQTGHVPDSISIADLKNIVTINSRMPTWFDQATGMQIYSKEGDKSPIVDPYLPPKDVRSFTLYFQIFANGEDDKDGYKGKSITITYDKSNDEYKAEDWFNSWEAAYSDDYIIPGGPPAKEEDEGKPTIDVNTLETKGLIKNLGSRPAQLRGDILIIETGIANYKLYPNNKIVMQPQDYSIEFKLAFPKNGQTLVDDYPSNDDFDFEENYWYSKEFKFTWEKTAIQGVVEEWFNNITPKDPSELGEEIPSRTYDSKGKDSSPTIEDFLNIPVPPKSVDTTIHYYLEDYDPEKHNPYDETKPGQLRPDEQEKYTISPDENSLTFTIGINSWDPERHEIVKTITIQWDKSRNNKSIEEWLASLGLTRTESGYPDTAITTKDVLEILGVDLPYIEDEQGNKVQASIEPIITKNDLHYGTDAEIKDGKVPSFGSQDINADTKYLVFYLTYYLDGKGPDPSATNHGLTRSLEFSITYEKTRQEYLNELVKAIEGYVQKLGEDIIKSEIFPNYSYTNTNASFGKDSDNKDIISWVGNALGLPEDYESPEIDTLFKSGIANLELKFDTTNPWDKNFESLNEVMNDDEYPAKNVWRKTTFNLDLEFLGATSKVNLQVNYQKMNMKDLIDDSSPKDFEDQLDQVAISGNTNQGKIQIKKSIVDYFYHWFLQPNLLIFNDKDEHFSLELKKGNKDLVDSGEYYIFDLTSLHPNFIANNNESNQVTFKLELIPREGFEDPDHVLESDALKAIADNEFFDIYIKTDDFTMWGWGVDSNALLQMQGTNTNDWFLGTNFPLGANFTLETRFLETGETILPSWVDPATLLGNDHPLWDQFVLGLDGKSMGQFTGNIEAKIKPNQTGDSSGLDLGYEETDYDVVYENHKDGNYVVSDIRQELLDENIRDKLTKVIYFGSETDPKNGTKEQNIFVLLKNQFDQVFRKAENTHDLPWNGYQDVIETILENNHLTIEYAIEVDGDGELDWGKWIKLPVSLKYLHQDRHFALRVSPKEGYQIIGNPEWDLADVANEGLESVRALKGYIPIQTEDPVDPWVNLDNVVMKGNTNIFEFIFDDDSGFKDNDGLKPGLEYVFSVDGETWLTKDDFKSRIFLDINLVKANFKFKIQVPDNEKNLFEIEEEIIGSINVDELLTYLDISDLEKIFDSDFEFDGSFGEGFQVIIKNFNPNLRVFDLAKRRLKLQFSLLLDGGIAEGEEPIWEDIPFSDIDQASGKIYINIKEDLIPHDKKPIIYFRLVPYLKDGEIPNDEASIPERDLSTQGVGPNASFDDYQEYTTAILSNNFVSKGQKITLPTVVKTPVINDGYFDFKSSLMTEPAHTRNLNIDILKSETNAIKEQYTGEDDQEYWDNLKYVFSIEDGNGSSQYSFLAADFAKWLKGDFATGSLPKVWKTKIGTQDFDHNWSFEEIANPRSMVYDVLPETYRLPNWNELKMDSITVQWATKTTNNVGEKTENPDEYNYYVPSESAPISLKDKFQDQVKKWFNVSDILKAIAAIYIKGDTDNYFVNDQNKVQGQEEVNTSWINDEILNEYGLKRELSVDPNHQENNWQETPTLEGKMLLPEYQLWNDKLSRSLSMRVVPMVDDESEVDWTIGKYVYLVYPDDNNRYEDFATTTIDGGQESQNGNRDFKVMVHADVDLLNSSNNLITGNQFTLDPMDNSNLTTNPLDYDYDDDLGIHEDEVDTNLDDYSVLEIEYLYDNHWYNKAALINALDLNRQAYGRDLAKITFPSDFSYESMQARWHLSGSKEDQEDVNNNYILDPTITDRETLDKQVSIASSIQTNNFYDFVNLWGLQDIVDQLYDGKIKYNLLVGDTERYTVGGSFNEAWLTLLNVDWNLYKNDIEIQYSTSQYPSPSMNSKDWKIADVKGSNPLTIFEKVAINNQHKSLYIRFVPKKDLNITSSTVLQAGTSELINPVRLDVGAIKFYITTDSNALTNLDMAGNTQSKLVANNLQNYFNGSDNVGLEYWKQVDGKEELQWIDDPKEREQWIKDNGIIIRWRVTQTREGEGKKTGEVFEFNSFDELKNTLISKEINFDRDSLEVQWAINEAMSETNQVTDDSWVKPSNTSEIINVIYSEDYVSLGQNTIYLSNNTLDLEARIDDPNAKQQYLASHHLKLQYSKDKINWVDQQPKQIEVDEAGNKILFIRLAPQDESYELGSDVEDDDNPNDNPAINQTTQLNDEYVQIPVVLGDSIEQWLQWLSEILIEGYTAWIPGHPEQSFKVKNYPNINGRTNNYLSVNNQPIGKWSYTVDQKVTQESSEKQDTWINPEKEKVSWANKLEEAFMSFFKNSKIYSFDHDYQDHFVLRYVLEDDQKPVVVGTGEDQKLRGGYVFTDATGQSFSYEQLKQEISIEDLIQYVYTDDNTNNLLPEFEQGHMSWKQMANQSSFMPKYNATEGKDEKADYEAMQYNGQHLNAEGNSLYEFDVNPNTGEVDLKRSLDNALAPRHAHFEYSYRTIKNNIPQAWSAWTTDLLTNLSLETNVPTFRVRIVPDAGYAIPSQIDWNDDGTKDDQNWVQEYLVMIIRDVDGLEAAEAKYIGFDDPNNPTGRFLTDNPDHDYSKGSPEITMNKWEDGKLFDWSAFKRDPAYVLEYNVFDQGDPQDPDDDKEISWVDSDGIEAWGWHAFEEAPGKEVPWKGHVPVSLKNGDVVKVRLRAKNGYIFHGEALPGEDVPPGFSNYSKPITYAPVFGLDQELKIPQDFNFFDQNYHVDFLGDKINFDKETAMPKVSFAGSEGKGTISIDPGSLANFSEHLNFEVQVLRPFDTDNLLDPYYEGTFAPTQGYYVLNSKGEVVGGDNPVKVLQTQNVTPRNHPKDWLFDWNKNIDIIQDETMPEGDQDTWVDPNDVNYLHVGDAVRIKVLPKSGYAFKWEDPETSFTDQQILPKKQAQFAYNRGGALANGGSQDVAYTTPLPVTGLLVKPSIYPQDTNLLYSTKPGENINGNAVITINPEAETKNHWYYGIRISYNQGKTWSDFASYIPKQVSNGVLVEVSIKLDNGFEFDPDYAKHNVPQVHEIKGLKDKIDSASIPRPKLEFAGYEGLGQISTISPDDPTKSYGPADEYGMPSPIGGESIGGVKWQYQVVGKEEFDPRDQSNIPEIINLPWSDKPPSNLKVGDYVRMRAFAKDEGSVVYPFVYSAPSDGKEPSDDANQGWVETSNLKINPANINITTAVEGFIGKTTIKAFFHNNSLDEKAVIVQYCSYDIDSPNQGKWVENPSDEENGLTTLTNESTYSIRLKAKPGFIFDENDPFIKNTPGMKVIFDEETSEYYLEYDDPNLDVDDWTNIDVEGLKKYLDVEKVEILKPNPDDGLANYIPMEPEKELINGKVQIVDPEITNLDSVSNLVGEKGEEIDGTYVKYADMIEYQFVLQRKDPNTGSLSQPIYSKKAPKNLNNGDVIKVELIVKEEYQDDYQLSHFKSVLIVVEGLLKTVPWVEKPRLTFMGANGQGSVHVANAPEEGAGMSWEFAWSKQGTPLPKDEDLVWHSTLNGLSNGDLVKVRMVDNFTKEVVYQNLDPDDPDSPSVPVISDWTTVTGLINFLDFSNHRVKIFNSDSPWDPNINLQSTLQNVNYATKLNEEQKEATNFNYAFRLEGNQEGQTSVKIATPLYAEDDSPVLLDVNGNKLPEAEKLIWEFAVTDKVPIDFDQLNWSRALPQNLHSNQYVSAKLAIKDQYNDYEIINSPAQYFQIPQLEAQDTVETKLIIIIISSVLGTLFLMGASASIYVVLGRKKVNFRRHGKM